jgi:hypothetical protein
VTYRNGSSLDGRHYWLTPPELRAEIYGKYGCTFDPCPFPRPADFDGLAIPWQEHNFVNPPFDHLRIWVAKALAEFRAGRSSVLLVPVKQWEMDLFSCASEVLSLGRVRWLATEDAMRQRSGKGWPILAIVLDPKGRRKTGDEQQVGQKGPRAIADVARSADLRPAESGSATHGDRGGGARAESVCEMPAGARSGALCTSETGPAPAGGLAV